MCACDLIEAGKGAPSATNASDLMSEVKKGGLVINLRLPFTLRRSGIRAQAIHFIPR